MQIGRFAKSLNYVLTTLRKILKLAVNAVIKSHE